DMKALPTCRSSARAAPRTRGSEMSDPALNEAADKLYKGVQEVFSALQELLLQFRGNLATRHEPNAEVSPISSKDLL
ncbi:DUF1631 domain-containing protein, partial [Pseudomonas syringae pv. tagetis]